MPTCPSCDSQQTVKNGRGYLRELTIFDQENRGEQPKNNYLHHSIQYESDILDYSFLN